MFSPKTSQSVQSPVKPTVSEEKSASIKSDEEKNEAETTLSTLAVREAVPEVRSLIRKHRKNTEALLASARSYNIKKGVIVIGFQSPVLKDQFEKGEHLDIVQRAFSHILQTEVKVRAVVVNSKDQMDNQNLDFDSGGLVSTALDLGGKLVDKE